MGMSTVPPSDQKRVDDDENAEIRKWVEYRRHQPTGRVPTGGYNGLYTRKLRCSNCGHASFQVVQQGQVARTFYCPRCSKKSQSRIVW